MKYKYFAKINNKYYSLFKVSEAYSSDNQENHFVKVSHNIHFSGCKKSSTAEFTIHPEKIHIKTILKGLVLVGDFKCIDSGSNEEYETLFDFGYDDISNFLIPIWACSYNDGFSGKNAWEQYSLPKDYIHINFPTNMHRPYWINYYFTSFGEDKIQEIFKEEDLDEIVFVKQRKVNVVVLLKFLIPEWEHIENPDYNQSWVNPSYFLKKAYFIVSLGIFDQRRKKVK